MTLPASGAISFNNINVELGVSGTTQASLGQTSYRNLAGVASGAISMSNFYGKANEFAFTISSNQTNANLRTLAVNAGWNQSSKVVATINSGVYISSNGTGTPALTVNGSFPGGVELINNGLIIGMGGNGGNGGGGTYSGYYQGSSGGAGGLSLSVSSAISINNAGTIGGGGGGGGGGGPGLIYNEYGLNGVAGGGGGGGGRSSVAANSSGGSGGQGDYPYGYGPAGSGGSGTSGSAGGGGGAYQYGGTGGSGGGWGSSGASGGNGLDYAGAGGGGSGGGAVSGNGNITWIATGTRLGSIS
jgi:hypothetical protein